MAYVRNVLKTPPLSKSGFPRANLLCFCRSLPTTAFPACRILALMSLNLCKKKLAQWPLNREDEAKQLTFSDPFLHNLHPPMNYRHPVSHPSTTQSSPLWAAVSNGSMTDAVMHPHLGNFLFPYLFLHGPMHITFLKMFEKHHSSKRCQTLDFQTR